MTPVAVVIGIGNPYRKDDGVGPAVVELLRNRGQQNATLVESDGEAAALIALWDRQRLAILVDAIQADPPHPGRVHRLVVPRPAAERARAASSHGSDLGDAVELARELDRLPGRMVVFGIEAADVTFGVGLTPAVATAAFRVADEIAAEIDTERRTVPEVA
jgi:hydrogenase maturation protease